MVKTFFTVMVVSNIEGVYRAVDLLFDSFEKAKEKFDIEVNCDKQDLQNNGYTVHYFDKEDCDEVCEDGNYVVEESETDYTSYKYGYFSLSFVNITITQHTLEVK